MNWKGRGRKRSWSKFSSYPSIYLKGLRKTTTISLRITGLLIDTLNAEPPEYETRLTNHPSPVFGNAHLLGKCGNNDKQSI
jgi:hypothetical protein